jgi:hypothetical protein
MYIQIWFFYNSPSDTPAAIKEELGMKLKQIIQLNANENKILESFFVDFLKNDRKAFYLFFFQINLNISLLK